MWRCISGPSSAVQAVAEQCLDDIPLLVVSVPPRAPTPSRRASPNHLLLAPTEHDHRRACTCEGGHRRNSTQSGWRSLPYHEIPSQPSPCLRWAGVGPGIASKSVQVSERASQPQLDVGDCYAAVSPPCLATLPPAPFSPLT